jgi:tetratricopeptide (TPR) repeat protein
LALAIASARAATHPTFPLATLAADLGNSTNSLDSLHGGDPSSDVRAVFSWSYRTLSDGAARLFRLLGLHPGPDVTTPATASLAAVPPGQARTLLAELTQAQLLTEVTPGRYTFHDLLRAYAIEQSRAQDSDDARQAATHRLLDHYLHTAYAAALLLYPMWDPIALARPQPGVVPEALAGHDAALAWFAAEHHVLLAAVDVAVESGSDTHTWQLAWAFTTFLLRRAHWDELVAVQRAALHAAHRTGDRLGRGHALRGVAMSSFRRGDLGGAEDHLRQALSVYADLADATGQAHTHLGLAAIAIAEEQVRPGPALNHAWQALNLFRATGNRHGQAHALNSIGWCHTKLGDHQPAITYCTEALALLRLLGDRDGEAFTWDSLGHAHSDLADHEQAVICYQHAIELFRDLRDRYYEAGTLESLGDTHHAAGNLDAALKAWLPALDILDDLHHPDAEQVRGKLNVIHRNGTGAERG